MEDTDWRPSPCPQCGKLRDAAKTPVCRNVACDCYVNASRTFTPNETKRYVVMRSGLPPQIVTGKDELIQAARGAGEKDRIYELGAEVEIKVTVAVKNKPVYREGSYLKGTGK